jgi:hypothetical protein
LALKIYSINKHQSIRSVTDKLFLAAKFIKADLGEVLILAVLYTGYVETYSEKKGDEDVVMS